MKSCTLVIGVGLILAVSAPAWAVPHVPVPPGPAEWTFTAHVAYAEVFLEVTDRTNPLGLPVGIHNHVGIGFTDDDGTGTPAWVLYTGAQSTPWDGKAPPQGDLPAPTLPQQPSTVLLVSPVDITPAGLADPTKNGTQIAMAFMGVGAFEDKTRGRLFAAGMVQDSRSEETGTLPIPYAIDPDGTGGAPQLTFSLYNAYVEQMALVGAQIPQVRIDPDTGEISIDTASYANIATTFVNEGDEGYKVHIMADPNPDAKDDYPLNEAGYRYKSADLYGPDGPDANSDPDWSVDVNAEPEMPLRDDQTGRLFVDLDKGTYYDPDAVADPGGRDWVQMGWLGDPNETDEFVAWSFDANPDSVLGFTEQFNTGLAGDPGVVELYPMLYDPDGPGPLPAVAMDVFGSGKGSVFHAGVGQLVMGETLIGQDSKTIPDPNDPTKRIGYLNYMLINNKAYRITGSYLYGAVTGTFDSDPATWTFQQWEGHEVLQLKGPFTPEPVTMLGVLLACGGVAGYFRRRRAL